MEPIRKDECYTLSKIVSEKLKQYILEHQLRPGERLPSERDLVKTMNVSRSVLREALRMLENAGIIEIRHGEGAFISNADNITPITEHLLFMWKVGNKSRDELFELRMIFECAAINEAVRQASEEDLRELETAALRMREAADTRAIQAADLEFHRCLLKATANQLFFQMTDIIIEYFSQIPHDHMNEQEQAKAAEDHLQIVAALRERDAARARQLLIDHLNYSKTKLQIGNETL
jgi:DNA-binding FadR family transcriptional regulator